MTQRFGIVIFSRFGSSRLPGKALVDIAGRPLLGRVIDGARRVDGSPAIIVATSTEASDDAIAAFAAREGVASFRGPLDDVAQRALSAAGHYELDFFARVCGDRPFLNAGLIEDYAREVVDGDYDLVTNVPGETFAPGLTTEIVRVAALARALTLATEAGDREHVTAAFYKYPAAFKVCSRVAPGPQYRGTRLVVDTAVDLARARAIAQAIDTAATLDDAALAVALGRRFDAEHGRSAS